LYDKYIVKENKSDISNNSKERETKLNEMNLALLDLPPENDFFALD